MRRLLLLSAVSAASLWLAADSLAAPPWQDASTARLALTDAEAEIAIGDTQAVRAKVGEARVATTNLLAGLPTDLAKVRASLDSADRAATRLDAPGFAAARAAVWTTILFAAFDEAISASRRGDVAEARAWLLVREFRPPTRFSRAAADGTLALDRLEQGSVSAAVAATAVRTDLLDTYDVRLRAVLASLGEAQQLGFGATRAEAGALVLGYWSLLGPAYRAQQGAPAWRATTRAIERLDAAARSGQSVKATLDEADRRLEGFRAAPLSEEETLRRAGQLDRFIRLVAIEYDEASVTGG